MCPLAHASQLQVITHTLIEWAIKETESDIERSPCNSRLPPPKLQRCHFPLSVNLSACYTQAALPRSGLLEPTVEPECSFTRQLESKSSVRARLRRTFAGHVDALTGKSLGMDANPYSPPDTDNVRVLQWRLIPAATLGILGIPSFVVGSYVFAMSVVDLFTEGIASFGGETPFAIGFFTCHGVSWIAGALLLWKKKYAYGVLLIFVGIAVPITLSSLYAL